MKKLLVVCALLIVGCGASPEALSKPKLTKMLVSYDESSGSFRVHELTDPANGERFLIVESYNGISITPANLPLPLPAPTPTPAVTSVEH